MAAQRAKAGPLDLGLKRRKLEEDSRFSQRGWTMALPRIGVGFGHISEVQAKE